MARLVPKQELMTMTGVESGPTDWLEIDQERIDRFADATGDHQFIHVDPKRASETPFGGTIAHGFLTLSLLPRLLSEIAVRPRGTAMTINYGLDKVRFLQPVVAGGRVRARSKIVDVVEKRPGHVLVKSSVTVEIRGEEKAALIAETLMMFVLGGDETEESE